jgi:hypothetical protein
MNNNAHNDEPNPVSEVFPNTLYMYRINFKSKKGKNNEETIHPIT